MNFTFFDRTPAAALLVPQATISYAGQIIFNSDAVRALGLASQGPAHLVRNDDTRRWYAVFGEVPGRKAAALLASNSKGRALNFTHRAAARAFYEQFQISPERKSIALPLSTTPQLVEGLALLGIDTTVLGLPLAPELPEEFQEPGPVCVPQPAAEATEPEPEPEVVVPVTPQNDMDVAQSVMHLTPDQPAVGRKRRYSDEQLERIRAEYPTGDLVELAGALGCTVPALRQQAANMDVYRAASAPKMPAARTAEKAPRAQKPSPAPKVTPDPHGSELPAAPDKQAPTLAQRDAIILHWYERELSMATEKELAEIFDVLSRLQQKDIGFYEQAVLDRAQAEQKRRQRQAA